MQVDYEPLEAGVIGIKLNRPEKLNAFSPALESEFLDAIRRACADESVRVVIFSGAGRGFSGGWDLASPDLTDAEQRSLSELAGLHTWVDVVRLLRRPDKLFICAVHGWAAGQGLELCIASDLVVAAAGTKFYFAHFPCPTMEQRVCGHASSFPRRWEVRTETQRVGPSKAASKN